MASPKRTVVAQAALDTGNQLMLGFVSRPIGVEPQLRLGVAGPGGMSTDGGKLARQALSLTRVDRPEGVMIGWFDVSSKRAALRPFTNVRDLYTARFHASVPFSEVDYVAYAADLKAALTAQGFVVGDEVAPVPMDSFGSRPTPRRALWAAGGFALAAVVAAAIASFA